ncbi:MAG: hypothetical protein AAGF07_03730 [Patescibacteria group bacterium]
MSKPEPNIGGAMKPVFDNNGNIKGFQNYDSQTGKPDTSKTFTEQEIKSAQEKKK